MVTKGGSILTTFLVLAAWATPSLAQVSPDGAWTAIDLDTWELVGRALLIADFDANGQADLAYSADNHPYGNVRFTRSVGSQILPVGTIVGSYGSHCGWALAAGKFASNSARPRIAVGCPANVSSPTGIPGFVRIYRIPASNDQVTFVRELRPGVEGMAGSSTDGDQFGYAVAAGDFDGDGAEDLAIGSPGAWSGGTIAGAVFVVYGAASGIDPADSQRWTQNSVGVPDSSELYDHFGSTLATGDFDGDGFDDLAIGAKDESVDDPYDNSGAVTILYGSPAGIATTGAGSHPAQWLTQGDTVVPGESDTGDYFGASLAAGQIVADNGVGGPGGDEDDLVIGAYGEDVLGEQSAGVAFLLVGRSGGFTAAGAQILSQAPLAGAAVEAGDNFGEDLAVADFSGDGWDDIAVNAPWDSVGGVQWLGVVHLIFGGAGGLDIAGAQLLIPDESYPFAPWSDDHFGSELAGGDLDGDGAADLAVGSPWWDYRFPDPDIDDPGNVMVLWSVP